MAYCSNCGSQLVNGAKFCQKCGVAVGNKNTEENVRQQEFSGRIFKCPNCGEVLNSFVRNCPTCGLEFRATRATSSVREFALKLEAIEAGRTYRRKDKRGLFFGDSISETDEQKINLIRHYTIPNSTEDILEFMILASSNMDYSAMAEEVSSAKGYQTRRAYAEAWLVKIKQAYSKAQNSVGDNNDFIRIKSIYEQCIETLKKQKRKHAIKVIVLGGWPFFVIAILLLTFSVIGLRSTHKEEKRLTMLEAEIVECLSQNELVEAAGKVSYLYTDNNRLKKEWNTIQNSYIKQIQNRSVTGTLLVLPPLSSSEVLGKDYRTVEELFRMSGFVRVTTEERKDLLSDETEKEYTIESVKIGNNEVFEKRTVFSFTDGVVIKYHVLNKVSPPEDSNSLRWKNYKDVEALFVKSGFNNIALEESNASILNGKGKVKEVSIDGDDSFSKSSSYFADAKVVIRYYRESDKP